MIAKTCSRKNYHSMFGWFLNWDISAYRLPKGTSAGLNIVSLLVNTCDVDEGEGWSKFSIKFLWDMIHSLCKKSQFPLSFLISQ